MSDMTSRSGWMDFANPTRFVGLADKVVPWLA
ncbi:MAG: heme transporter HemC, partial [Mesorhizobium sp.]